MIHRFVLPLVSLCALWTAGPTQSAVVTLSPTADVRILDFFPNSNFNNDALLSVFTGPGNTQRTLLKFDLSGIPISQQIVSATLTLTANTGFGNNFTGQSMDVHAVTTPWIENQATWNSASAGTPWTTAGGDFNPFIYATSTAFPLDNAPVTWDLTSLVQDWYDGSIANEGLLLRSFNGNGLSFDSTNAANPVGTWPSLAIEYTAIPEASSLLMLGMGIVTVLGVAGGRRALLDKR